jgi:hypothetical protein
LLLAVETGATGNAGEKQTVRLGTSARNDYFRADPWI